ncbi:hypothetical protein EJB05_21190, partial [Eragrostis curvula]
MALSQKTWVAAGLGARLLMLAFLAMALQLTYNNLHNGTRLDYSNWHNCNKLKSYTYAMVAAGVGMAGGLLQVPIAVYLLCKSKRMAPSVLVLDISMYTDIVSTYIQWSPPCWPVESARGSAPPTTPCRSSSFKYGMDWTGHRNQNDPKGDLTSFFNKGNVAISFLLVGMVLSVFDAVVSARLRARASDDLADD